MINMLFDNDQNMKFLIDSCSCQYDNDNLLNEIITLIDSGFEFDGIVYDSNGDIYGSYLQYALSSYKLDVAKILIAYDAKVNKVDNSMCYHPLFYIFEHEETDVLFLKYIIENTDKETIGKLLQAYLFNNEFRIYSCFQNGYILNQNDNHAKLVKILIDMNLEYEYIEFFL